jgi:hypothetical protein
MDTLLAHPLTSLFVGAVLSGLIIPLMTRNWQYRQKSLEIKTVLVSEIGQVVMEFLMSVQHVHMRKENRKTSQAYNVTETQIREEQAEFGQAHKIWEVKSAVIGTKLQAYLPKSDIPRRWTEFSKVVTHFYALEGVVEPQLGINMSALARQISDTLSYGLPESASWDQLYESILQCKSEIIRSVLRAKVSLG